MQAQRSATTRWRDRGADVSVQRQARALGDPTRHAIFRYVADSSQPVDIATLTAHFGLNHNAIRQHLTKLCAARLLIETQAVPTGPGRPRLEYRPAPEGAGSWGTPSPYQQLSLLLLAALRSGRAARAVGAEAGRALAGGLPHAPDPVDVLEAHAARHGFEPQRIERPSVCRAGPRPLPIRGRRGNRSRGRLRASPRTCRRHRRSNRCNGGGHQPGRTQPPTGRVPASAPSSLLTGRFRPRFGR